MAPPVPILSNLGGDSAYGHRSCLSAAPPPYLQRGEGAMQPSCSTSPLQFGLVAVALYFPCDIGDNARGAPPHGAGCLGNLMFDVVP